MKAVRKRSDCLVTILLVGLGVLFGSLPAASAPIRLRTIVDEAGLKATPEIGAKSLVKLPLGTLVEALDQTGEWYKVTATIEGNQVSGYIHEMLVEPAEEGGDLGRDEAGGAPSYLAAQIDLKIGEAKEFIRNGQNLVEALQTLDGLLARVFRLEDLKLQRQLAVDIYFWLGLARVTHGDEAGGLREFKKMFEVDADRARVASRNITQPNMAALLKQAEQEFLGVVVDYTLEVNSQPAEAEVTANGTEKGLTPSTFRSRSPKFIIEVKKPGYKTVRDEVYMASGFERKEYALEVISRSLKLVSHPAGAAVQMNGRDTGQKTDCVLEGLTLGAYQIRLVKDNYADWQSPLTVEEGQGPLALETFLVGMVYLPQAAWTAEPESPFLRPVSIAAGPGGEVFVADESPFKLRKFDAGGKWLKDWTPDQQVLSEFKNPGGLAVDGTGHIYATDIRRNIVLKIDPAGRWVARFGKEGSGPDDFKVPADVAVDSQGNVYVVDWGNSRIKKYSSTGQMIKAWGSKGETDGLFNLPRAVAVGARNEVFVLDRSRVQRFSGDGTFIGSWGRAGGGPGEFREAMGLSVDRAGSVYVADSDNHRLQKFDDKGNFLVHWGGRGREPGKMGFPCDLLVDGQGRVLVVERDNNRIQLFAVPSQ
jgi:DNA-binding beta-propeller fold protein YncE